jgi:hypothetical protein
MKPIYQLNLIANNKMQDIDKLFGIKLKTRNDYDAGWDHCAFDYKFLAEFVHDIIHVRDHGGKDVCRLTITKHGQRNSKSSLLCSLGKWDANEKELEYINKGFRPTKRDRARLVSYIIKKCDKKFKAYDKAVISSKKRIKELKKALHKKRFDNLK